MNKDDIIFVVEDDKFLRNLLVKKLKTSGASVEIAENGKEVFTKLKEFTPKLILLDLILPDINGFQILSILKKDERTKDIPVVVLSNLGQKEDMDKARELGATDYMVKAHFTPNDILEKVKTILG